MALVFIVCALGCSRQTHRETADRVAYSLLRSRQFDERWKIPHRTVEPDPRSRMADIHDPDCGPLPPDDPASQCYMRNPFNSKKRVDYWDERGEALAIDSQQWLQYLPYDDEGNVFLDKEMTVELALIHNRDFQTQVEQLYTQALALSSNRFEFMLNWFGSSNLDFTATDDGQEAIRGLTDSNSIGFNRNLATGGQFAANLANSFSWNFNGNGSSNFSAGNLAFALSQPLLRGAFRHVRTESLTQSERSLLYAVRDFARFRRQFYLQTVQAYFDLLVQSQAVKIEEENIELLEQSVREHELRLQQKIISPIQADQVFQNYQSSRLTLINSQQQLQTALDQFKFQLGLPARVPVKLDESILNPFTLNSANVEQLNADVSELKSSLNQYLPPLEAPDEFLNDAIDKIEALAKRVEEVEPTVKEELKEWFTRLEENPPSENAEDDIKANYEQQLETSKLIEERLAELEEEIADGFKAFELRFKNVEDKDLDASGVANEDDSPAVKKWKLIEDQISRPGGLSDRIETLFIFQTQIRLFLIEIKPLSIEQEQAVEIALQNRLDLMNSRAAVTDAYRGVEIAADQLQSDLSVQASADLQTDPTRDNAFRFDGDENVYGLGLNFDGPLNRLNERNGYRAAQIAYQQQRRAYMADEDSIVNSVRFNIRQLKTNRFNFQIAQQRLIIVARQVRQAQLNLRVGSGDSSSTQDLLQAFQTLRDTKNSLVSSWVAYETSRIALFVDLEFLMLDSRGKWINEEQDFNQNTSGQSQLEGGTTGEPDVRPEFEPDDRTDPDDGVEPDPSNPDGIEPPDVVEPLELEAPSPEVDAPTPDSGGVSRRRTGNLLGRQ